MKLRKITSLIVALAMIAMCCAISVPAFAAGTIAITSPTSGSVVKAGNVTFTVDASDITSLVFYLDGTQFATFDADDTFSATAKADAGNRQFKAVATFADETTKTVVSDFVATTSAVSPVNDGASTAVQDFNTLGAEYSNRTNDANALAAFSENFGWTISGSNAFVQRVAGKSGAADDYAIRVIGYGASTNTDTYFTYNGWNEKVTSGTIVLQFDAMFSPIDASKGGTFSLDGIPMYNTSNIVNNAGTVVANTEYAITGGTWYNFKYEYDVDNNEISLEINGTKCWDKCTATVDGNDLSKLSFRPIFWSASSYWVSNYWAYIGFDNISVCKKANVSVASKGYSLHGAQFDYDGKVPSNADGVGIELSSDVAVAASDIKVMVNGAEVAANFAGYANKTVSVALPEVEAGDVVNVVVSSDGLADSVSEFFTIGEALEPSVSIKAPANGSISGEYNGKITLSANAVLAGKVKFFIDDTIVKEFAEPTADGFYTADVDVSDFAYGTHIFKAVSEALNSSTVTATSNFVLGKSYDAPVQNGASMEVQGFDAMGSEYDTASYSADTIAAFSRDFGWTLDSADGTLDISRIAGASGKDGDWAVKIKRNKSGNNGSLKLDAWTEKVTSGIAVVEFDMFAHNVGYADIRLFGINYGAFNNLFYENKIHNTDITTANRQWYHFKIAYNAETNRADLWVDGNKISSDVYAKSEYNTLSELIIKPFYWTNAIWAIENGYAYIALDNFSVKTIQTIVPGSKVGYSVSDCNIAGSEFSCTVKSENYTDSAEKYTVAIASYAGDKLTAVTLLKNLDAPKGIVSDTKTLSVSDDADLVKVFVWDADGSVTPKIPATSYEIVGK